MLKKIHIHHLTANIYDDSSIIWKKKYIITTMRCAFAHKLDWWLVLLPCCYNFSTWNNYCSFEHFIMFAWEIFIYDTNLLFFCMIKRKKIWNLKCKAFLKPYKLFRCSIDALFRQTTKVKEKTFFLLSSY